MFLIKLKLIILWLYASGNIAPPVSGERSHGKNPVHESGLHHPEYCPGYDKIDGEHDAPSENKIRRL